MKSLNEVRPPKTVVEKEPQKVVVVEDKEQRVGSWYQKAIDIKNGKIIKRWW